MLCVALGVTTLSSTLGTPIGDGAVDAFRTDSTSSSVPLDTIIAALVSEGIEWEPFGECGGYGCILPEEQWQSYLRLRAAATDAELIALLEYDNPVVIGYAFRALVDRNHPSVFDIVLERLNDTTTVRVYSACLLMDMAVADYMIMAIKEIEYDSQSVLTTAQRASIDSLLLHTPNLKFWNRRSMLEKLKPKAEDHSRLRQLVIEEGESVALVALARHRRTEDRPLVLAALRSEERRYTGLRAVEAFPDESFYSDLVGIFRQLLVAYDSYPWQEFDQVFNSLAQYPRSSTVALFRDALREPLAWERDEVIEVVSAAVTTHRHPIFLDLLPLLGMDQDAVAAYRRSLEAKVQE
jgi:hypothetical protein